jgi:hypothetical protein
MASPSPAFYLPFLLPFDPKLFGGFLYTQKPNGLVVHLVASMSTLSRMSEARSQAVFAE